MADRKQESSVLFSLRELRNIEEERVKTEEESERARLEAERRAKEEEVRRAREAEEARVRADQERLRQEQLEMERIAHDAQVRLQEAQHRAQIEQATKLEAHRIDSLGMAYTGRSPDAYEGITSFLEKRAPRFTQTPGKDLPPFYPWWPPRSF